MEKNVIKKIELDLGKKTITLNMEQAKKLKDALDGLFGKEVIREVHEHHHHDYATINPYYWCWEPYRVTCDNDTSTGYSQTAYFGNTSVAYNAGNQTMCLSLT